MNSCIVLRGDEVMMYKKLVSDVGAFPYNLINSLLAVIVVILVLVFLLIISATSAMILESFPKPLPNTLFYNISRPFYDSIQIITQLYDYLTAPSDLRNIVAFFISIIVIIGSVLVSLMLFQPKSYYGIQIGR
jgi:quinol-cytochrome oxidoreductase complex cytochrome b subunit